MRPSVVLTRVRLRAAAMLAATVLAAACGGDGAPVVIVPTRIAFATQPDSALVGDSVALGAATTDASGRHATIGSIAYTSSDTTVARVSAAGVVRFVGAGPAVITARVTGLPNSNNTLTLATPSLIAFAPAAKVRALPSRVDAAPGAQVPLAAAVFDSAGNQISYPVGYTSDNAAVAGITAASLTAGTAGSATITVRANFRGRGVSTTLPVTIAPLAPGAFHIDLVPIGFVDPTYAVVFTRAAAFWQSVITAALPSVSLSLDAGACGAGTPAVNSTSTGLTIFVRVDSIDGPGSVLGAAGPCVLRSDPTTQLRGLPLLGSMWFDSADFAGLIAKGTAYDVIRHEMGHVLGIGTLWNVTGVRTDLTGSDTFDPEYVGPLGESGSATLGFTLDGASVPVENVGGSGTVGAHWRSSVFRSELMTGYLIAAPSHPASRLTILSLADLGYAVNVAASEPLLPPSAALGGFASRAPSTSLAPRELGGEMLNDVALPPIYHLAPDGRVHRLAGVPALATALGRR